MKFEQDKLGKIKHALHGAQAVLIFIAWALALAVLTKQGQTGGQTGFYFGLCFLSVPALIYNVMVPVWPRARRLANVYAYATIDVLFTLLWFSAAVAVAAWNSAGIEQGRDAHKDSDGSCNYFAFGDAAKCSVSKASAGFGILICFLFASTSIISINFCKQYRQTGQLPGVRERPAAIRQADDATKDIWSTNVEERDDEMEEPDERRKYGQIPDGDGEGLLQNASHSQQHADPHPGAPLRYESSENSLREAQRYDQFVPSALSPGEYEHRPATTTYQPPPPSPRLSSQGGRINFPDASYDRM